MGIVDSVFGGISELMDAAFGGPTVKRGDTGRKVALLQAALVNLGFALPRSTRADGSMDGIFGGEMYEAVCRFQIRHGLVDSQGRADGIVGRFTMAALELALSAIGATAILLAGGGKVPKPVTPTALPPARRLEVPEGAKLRAAYESFRPQNGRLCKRSGDNQCAIRMSVALAQADCGFSFANLRNKRGLHEGGPACGCGSAHVDSASGLADYLRRSHLPAEFYRPEVTPWRKILARVHGRRGIIYLRKCFPLNGGRGSHIDYWDGAVTMNEALNYHGRGEPPSSARMFEFSREKIWFFPAR